MKNYRRINKITKGQKAIDGAGVHLVRVFGYGDTSSYDPFLMLDAFDETDSSKYIKGFPWHPHRGIETVTYLIEGEMEHQDSLGNKGVIKGGDCQWMTAGSGIIHQEMPIAGDRLLGAQLWLNLPREHKMTEPKYGDIRSENIPLIAEGEVKIKVVAGSYKGNKGAFKGEYVDATYLDVQIPSGQEWTLDTKEEDTVFLYIFKGKGIFSKEDMVVEEKNAVLFSQGDGIYIKAREDLRFILLQGKGLREPIAWGGPIVMNSKEELDLAFKELQENNFIKS